MDRAVVSHHRDRVSKHAVTANERANQLFNNQKWEEAAKAFEVIVAAEPDNARAWYQLGMSRFSLTQFEHRSARLRKHRDHQNPTAMYNVACAYARLKQKDKAIEWLEKAVSNNLSPFTNIAADQDLARLVAEPRFKELADDARQAASPLHVLRPARAIRFLDRRVGRLHPQGQKAGTSVIQQISDGCGILENWTGTRGGSGKSINFYDPGSASGINIGWEPTASLRAMKESIRMARCAMRGSRFRARTRFARVSRFFNLDAILCVNSRNNRWTKARPGQHYDFKY
jgi:tetratricopeptide (TPR) repeat protein